MVTLADRESERYWKLLDDLVTTQQEEVATMLSLMYRFLPRPKYQLTVDDRSRYDVYRSAASRLLSGFGNSALVSIGARVLGLGEVADKLHVYSDRLNAWASASYKYRDACFKWDAFAGNAVKAFGEEDTQGAQLYASLKTWKDDEAFTKFDTDLTNYVGRRTEVWLLAPFELFLSLSDDAFMILVRRFCFNSVNEDKQCNDVLTTVLDFRDMVKESWESGVLDGIRSVIQRVDKEYLALFHSSESSLRSVVPTIDAKKRYISYVEERLAL